MLAFVLVDEKGDTRRVEIMLKHFLHHPAGAPNDDFIDARQFWVVGEQRRFDGGRRVNPRERAQRVGIARIETRARLHRDRFQTVTREQARQR